MLVRGWVYVMHNEAMPDLVKVGFTLKDPVLRAAELDHTGTPVAPKVVYEVFIDSPRDVEQGAHARLRSTHAGKEWFRCSPNEAISAIRDTISECRKRIILESVQSGAANARRQRIYELHSTYDYNRSPEPTAVPPRKVEWPSTYTSGTGGRSEEKRLRELLSVPECDRSRTQWDEIIDLQTSLAKRGDK